MAIFTSAENVQKVQNIFGVTAVGNELCVQIPGENVSIRSLLDSSGNTRWRPVVCVYIVWMQRSILQWFWSPIWMVRFNSKHHPPSRLIVCMLNSLDLGPLRIDFVSIRCLNYPQLPFLENRRMRAISGGSALSADWLWHFAFVNAVEECEEEKRTRRKW